MALYISEMIRQWKFLHKFFNDIDDDDDDDEVVRSNDTWLIKNHFNLIT